MKMKTRWFVGSVAVALLVGMAGCNGIPSPYRGKFVDTTAGVTLELKSDSGSFSHNGKTSSRDAEDVEVENFLKGKPGIYLEQSAYNEDIYDLYWIEPNASTRQEVEGGLVWFEAEVFYIPQVDKRISDPVKTVSLVHDEHGQLLIDTMHSSDSVRKAVQIGWSRKPERYQLTRVED